MHRKHALHTNAKGLLADGERLAGTVSLALDDDTLEHLDTPTGALDHLEVHLDAVAGREVGDTAQLRTLDAFDNGAHKKRASCERESLHSPTRPRMVANRAPKGADGG